MITREQLRGWNACYSDERIAELVPPEGVTLEQVLDSDIPHKDKMWASAHALPRHAKLEALARMTERCIGYGTITDERITCLPAAIRADAVTGEMLSAAAKAAADAADAAKAAEAWAAALAAAAAWAYAEAERQKQIEDIREVMEI